MQMFLAILSAFLVSCSAFSVGPTRSVRNVNALSMATISDTFNFRKPNRLVFKTLYAALSAAGLAETFQGPGPFTVYAPTDAAFANLEPGVLEGLLADIPALTKILTYHANSGTILGEAIRESDKKTLPTLNGAAITVSVEDGKVYLDDAKVNCFDIECDNGIIHAIDMVLIPGK